MSGVEIMANMLGALRRDDFISPVGQGWMIGVSLLAEGFQFNIPKGYIYFSMAFAFLVDIIQMRTVHHTSKNTK